MATTREEIRAWIDRGISDGSSHMLVVCDTYDWEDYPVYAKSEADARASYAARNGVNMQKVMEVYRLSGDIDAQLRERRSFNF